MKNKLISGITCLLAIFTGLGFLRIAHIKEDDNVFIIAGYCLLIIALTCGSIFYQLIQQKRQII